MNEISGGEGPVTVTMILDAQPGEEGAVGSALEALAGHVQKHEPGCQLYQPLRSSHEPTRFLVLERYQDEDALRFHANAEYYREVLEALIPRLSRPPELAVYGELEQGRSGGPGR